MPGGSIADVRIFSFGETKIYVPARWLELPDRTPDIAVGDYDPDVHRIECPGVVHRVTDGGILFGRYAGVYLDPGGRGEAPGGKRSGVYFQKIRTGRALTGSDPKFTGIVPGIQLRSDQDAYVRIAGDVGVRLYWRPAGIDRDAWIDRADRFSAGPAMATNPLLGPGQQGAWGHLVGTRSWMETERSMRLFALWLQTAPARRAAIAPTLPPLPVR